jgi:hypothetical protein
MPPINLACTIDARGLNQALMLAQEFSTRTPAEAANTSGYEIAVNAKNTMPFVTTGTMDAELGTISTPIMGKRGKPLSQKKAKNKIYSGGKMGDIVKGVPLAVLIVVARAKPGSNYNLTTNNRYALAKNPFKGVSRAAGEAAMAALVDVMIRNRHRSGHFLMAGWIPAVRELANYTVNKFSKRSTGTAGSGGANYFGPNLGSAMPASQGTSVSCTIENNIGYSGVNAASFNRALILYGTGPLQTAVDNEGLDQANYYLKKAGEKLEYDWNRTP